MATIFPTPANSIVEQTPQNYVQHGPRPRQYTPYIFQPNFLKQQIKQRVQSISAIPEGIASGPNSIPLNEGEKHGFGTSHSGSQAANLAHHGSNAAGSILEDIGRKKGGRKVIDWTSSCALYLQNRRFQRDFEDVPDVMPDTAFSIEMQSVAAYRSNPVTSITSKFIRSATNKMKCPVYKVVWTPDGRRLVTGSASGEFTLWNGTAFNFETILQAHDSPVRAMAWSKHDSWLITGDNQGYIKYWQLNMNNVKMYQAHKDQACRSVSFGPTDHKFATASDDGTVRVWDFLRCHEERILRGHGADVKQVAWHPVKGIVASASKDLHTPVKLWDPKTGQSLTTLHAHKGTVMDVKWNQNGNWLLSASRDHLIKLYDIRNVKQEMQVFRGHKKEAFSVSWHPIHEDLFASGGSEGSILFWQVGEEKEAGLLEGAHDSLIWSLEWHPLGHVLVSGSNDHSTKFWSRSRPGDSMRDRYNLPLLPQSQEETISSTSAVTQEKIIGMEPSLIPGMGDADVAAAEIAKRDEEEQKSGIPGLDWSYEEKNEFERKISSQQDRKKIPYARPVPRAFVAAWEANKEGAPPDRPRSPRFREREFERRRWRDDRGRDRGPPFRRNGPDGGRPGDPEHSGDDRIFVDGIEVGPDFDPDKIKSEDAPVDRPGPELPVHPGDRPRGPPDRRMSPGRRRPSFPDMGPPPGRPRDPEEKRRLREKLYAEVLRSGDERDMELLRELEEYGLPLEEALDDEIYFDENGDPITPIGDMREMDGPRGREMEFRRGPEGPQGREMERFPPDVPPLRPNDGEMPGRGRGFRNRGPGFPPERGKKGRNRRRSPPPRMRRGGGPPR